MTVKLEIGYEQLLQLFRQLSPKQQKQFLQDAEKEALHLKTQDMVEESTADYPLMDIQSAAMLLLDDYQHNKELTAFSALDTEAYHETR